MISLSLDWHGDLKFANSPGSPAIELHSSTPGVSSPPQALAYAVMACMAMDVVHVIQKGRHPFTAMTVKFEGERADEHPRRFVSMSLDFQITGKVDDRVVERAIELSRTKYCSVWNTVRPDVKLRTSFTIFR
jgi:putative redox protein